MKTRPERFRIVAAFALWTAAACAACTARAEPQPPEAPLSSEAAAFLQARSQPRDVSGAAAEVEVRGAVGRPGPLRLAPGVETLEQALHAAGGLRPEAVTVRVRLGKDPLRKLFAEAPGASAAVDLPVAELAAHGPVYLRPGDVLDAVSSEGSLPPPAPSEPSPAVSSEPVPAAATSGGEASSVQVSSSSLPQPPAGSAAPEDAPTSEASERPDALAEVRAEISALRTLLEKQNEALRSEIAELKGEQARLRASLDQASRPHHAPASVAAAPPRSPLPAAAPSAAPAPARADTAAAATVIVSGAVKKPGVYPVVEVKTVAGAVSAAGRRDDANLHAVEIRPEDQGSALLGIGLGLGGHPGKQVLDVTAVASGSSADVPLGGGEAIFVPATRGGDRPVESVR